MSPLRARFTPSTSPPRQSCHTATITVVLTTAPFGLVIVVIGVCGQVVCSGVQHGRARHGAAEWCMCVLVFVCGQRQRLRQLHAHTWRHAGAPGDCQSAGWRPRTACTAAAACEAKCTSQSFFTIGRNDACLLHRNDPQTRERSFQVMYLPRQLLTQHLRDRAPRIQLDRLS